MEVEYYTIAEFQSCISDGISFRGGQKAEVSLPLAKDLCFVFYNAGQGREQK